MSMKKLWTLLILYGWPVPHGLRYVITLTPHRDRIACTLIARRGECDFGFVPRWSAWHYLANLDKEALTLVLNDAEYAFVTGINGTIKASVRRKAGGPC